MTTHQDAKARWFASRDPEAFRQLATQHAGMVLATAQRVLQNPADAEEIAQETFLALATTRRVPSGYLGPWLHRVALNLAHKKLRSETRRRAREIAYAEAQDMEKEPEWDDIRPWLDEGLDALPEKLRSALILHYLESQTHLGAARALGIPRQTLTNRVQRGLEELRRHLRRRGVEISSGALAAMLAANAGPAESSSALLTGMAKLGTSGYMAPTGWSGMAVLKMVLATALLAGGAGWVLLRAPREPTSAPVAANDAAAAFPSVSTPTTAPTLTPTPEPAQAKEPQDLAPAIPVTSIETTSEPLPKSEETLGLPHTDPIPVVLPENLVLQAEALPRSEITEELRLELPEAFFGGTPLDYWSANLEPEPFRERPTFLVPPGTRNLALHKPVTSSTPPLQGELTQVVDGNKDYIKSSVVELAERLQWVQIDLGARHRLIALALWHFHEGKRVYHDVVVWASEDETFIQDVTELYNNDHDNTADLGAGEDKEWVESNRGRLIAANANARYVRLFSQGNTANDLNHYVEVEVYGLPHTKSVPSEGL